MMGGSAGFPLGGAAGVFLIWLVVVPFALWYHLAKGAVFRESLSPFILRFNGCGR